MKATANKTSISSLVGQATDEQITAWKAANPDGIFGLKTEGHIAYFKEPNRDEINCAYTKAEREASLAMYEELANLTFLGGSDDMLKNTRKFLFVRNHMMKVLDGPKGEVVDL